METKNTYKKFNNQYNKIYWNAILTSIIVGFGIEILLNMLGVGLGLAVFQPNSDTLEKIGAASIIWLTIAATLSMLAAGWVAGWFSNASCRINCVLHGLIAWATIMLLMFVVTVNATTAFISGVAGLLNQSISLVSESSSAIGKNLMQLAPQSQASEENGSSEINPAIKKIVQQAEQLINRKQGLKQEESTGPENQLENIQFSEQDEKNLLKQISKFFDAENDEDKNLARENMVAFMSKTFHIDKAEAEKTLSDWQQYYEEMKINMEEKAKAAAKKSADLVSSVALISFLILFLSAIAAVLGSLIGRAKHEEITLIKTLSK